MMAEAKKSKDFTKVKDFYSDTFKSPGKFFHHIFYANHMAL
jgi:hypothetical protein